LQWSVVSMLLLFPSQFGALFGYLQVLFQIKLMFFVKNSRASEVDWL
jgi:hypothetical protein